VELKELIRPNGFGPFYCEGREILRQIFVSVRDRHWREIAATQCDCSVDEVKREILIKARHISEHIDFAWRGRLEFAANGRTMHFSFEGEAQRPMEFCRLGLIVLHPVGAMLGALVKAHGPDGAQSIIVASTISPQPIINGLPTAMTQPFDSLTFQRDDFGRLELKFSGDLFELEDQRNWGDASFKTYCTPLSKGFPRQIASGTRVAHRVEVKYTPAARSAATQDTLNPPRGKFPRIGCELSGRNLAESAALHWHHAHVDYANLPATQALIDANDIPLELGVDSALGEEPLAAQLLFIAEHRGRLARLLLYGLGSSPPSAEVLGAWRQALNAQGDAALPLCAATHGYFVEFNRSLSPVTATGLGLAFPLTATAHADDPKTILENVATIEDMADTARRVLYVSAIAIAPLALFHPASPERATRFPPALFESWLTDTLWHAALAGVDSVTLARDVTDRVCEATLSHLLDLAAERNSL
jgi:D-apionolactonase